jgi:hypothetical protein
VKTGLKISFKVLTHVRTDMRTEIRIFWKKKQELDGFSHENPDLVLKVGIRFKVRSFRV